MTEDILISVMISSYSRSKHP